MKTYRIVSRAKVGTHARRRERRGETRRSNSVSGGGKRDLERKWEKKKRRLAVEAWFHKVLPP